MWALHLFIAFLWCPYHAWNNIQLFHKYRGQGETGTALVMFVSFVAMLVLGMINGYFGFSDLGVL